MSIYTGTVHKDKDFSFATVEFTFTSKNGYRVWFHTTCREWHHKNGFYPEKFIQGSITWNNGKTYNFTDSPLCPRGRGKKPEGMEKEFYRVWKEEIPYDFEVEFKESTKWNDIYNIL